MSTTPAPVTRRARAPSRRRLNLAIVSPSASPTAVYTDNLCRALSEVAPEITVTVCAIDHDRRTGQPAVALSIAAEDPTAYRRAAHRLHVLGADVVLIQYRTGAATGPRDRYLLGLSGELAHLGVPYLVTLHGVRPSPPPGEADLVGALCRRAAGVITLSHAAARVLARTRLVPAGRIIVVPPGAPPELSNRHAGPDAGAVVDSGLAAALTGATTGPLLSTVAPLRPVNGIHVALAALTRIARHRPHVRYVVAATTRPEAASSTADRYSDALRRTVTTLGLDANVHLLDAVLSHRDLAALLQSTTIYLAPDLDRNRTSSTSLIWALAAGCPVISTDHLFARERVTHEVGLLVPPGDPAALTIAVNRLLHDPARLADARTAAARLAPSLSFTAAAEQVAQLAHLVARHRTEGRNGPTTAATPTRTTGSHAA